MNIPNNSRFKDLTLPLLGGISQLAIIILLHLVIPKNNTPEGFGAIGYAPLILLGLLAICVVGVVSGISSIRKVKGYSMFSFIIVMVDLVVMLWPFVYLFTLIGR